MVFNSFVFILVYLPILLIGWFGLGHLERGSLARVFLIAMSLWFYGMFGWQALTMLLVSAAVSYAASAMIARTEHSRGSGPSSIRAKIVATAGILLHLLLLIALKYASPIPVSNTLSLVMPVGFSFYTFSQISYLADRVRGEAPHEDLLTYLTWATYFPKLVEGPIVRYTELSSQLTDRTRQTFHSERFARGLILFTLGLGKKVLLADHLAPVADYGFTVIYLDTISMIAVVIAYAMQLYLDFSGFCDMAMGIGWMMNIDLPVNFDSPYKETSFGSFWGKWHMTLTRFLTTYVYIPLGGSRKGRGRAVVNVLLVFLLSGIWHGNGAHYIAWGLLTGILVVIYNQFLRDHVCKVTSGAGKALLRLATMVIFCVTLFFFRAETVGNALIMLRYLFRPLFPGWIMTAASQLTFDELYMVDKVVQILAPSMYQYLKLVEFLLLIAITLRLVYGRRNARQIAQTCRLTTRNAILTAIILVWCMLSFSGVSTFLYFKY